jgi:3',5'-cyclic-AMP phosphodiesterase
MKELYRVSVLMIILTGLVWACGDPVSFSPFEAQVADVFKNTTEKNLYQIRLLDTAANRPFKVVLLSDSHYHFSSLKDAIKDINQHNDFSFIIVTGDISENGLLKEFEIFHQIMSHSRIPYVTVIGNHDHLSNGAEIYRQMFGPLNYSFAFHGVKFVAWDNTEWESKEKVDYQWLEQALKNRNDLEAISAPYRHVIPFSHVPPFDGQFEKNKDRFQSLLEAHDIKLSVHGHKHEFSVETGENDIRYMTVGSPQKRNYAALTIADGDITISKIEY